MKCRLEDNPYCDKNFQIEFNNIKELEDLKDSLSSMLKYIKLCHSEGDEIPPLIYRIQEKEIINVKTK